MRRLACLACSVLAMGVCSEITQAAIVYDTFGPGDGFLQGGPIITGSEAGLFPPQSIAHVFTVSGGTYEFDSLEIAASQLFGTNSMIVSLRADSGGLPGAVLESFNLDNVLTDPAHIVSMNSVLHPTLEQGSSYWISVEAGAPGTDGIWCMTTVEGEAQGAARSTGDWEPASLLGGVAYRVTGDVVPEPSSALIVSALAGLTLLRRRGRRLASANS